MNFSQQFFHKKHWNLFLLPYGQKWLQLWIDNSVCFIIHRGTYKKYKMHEKRWLRCYLRLLNIVNFWKFSTLGPYNSKTGGHTTIKFLLKLLRVVKNDLVQTFFYLIFFTTRHKILPFGKKLPWPKNFSQFFFYSLDPPLSEFKVKIRGHLFTYRCYSSNMTIYNIVSVG